jgi:putative redox protein
MNREAWIPTTVMARGVVHQRRLQVATSLRQRKPEAVNERRCHGRRVPDLPCGLGPAPFGYYLASLSACTAITLRMYAERKGWNLGEFRAELALGFDDEGKVHVHRTLHSGQTLSDEQWQRLLEIVANTPVTKAMHEGAVITSERGG